MDAKVKYIDSSWIEIRIPKAVVILPMSQWMAGFKRGKSWRRRTQEQKREKQRRGKGVKIKSYSGHKTYR